MKYIGKNFRDKSFSITIDKEKDMLIGNYGLSILNDKYFTEDEQYAQQALARMSCFFSDDAQHAQRLYNAASNLWWMPASPVLSNAATDRGLPISCFLNFVPDSRAGLAAHYEENIWLSSNGGGIGGYWGAVRSDGARTQKGSKSTGSIPFMKVQDSITLAFSQGTNRRGAYAAYQDISHPEIEEFIGIRRPTGGDNNRKCLNLHHGVNIPDSFMSIIERCSTGKANDDNWPLIDPHSKEVRSVVSATQLWESILESRIQTGEPYIHFVDRSNELMAQCQKDLGLRIHQSNLCTEILLPTAKDRTAVCCLSSLNLEHYEQWKDTTLVADIIRMLDNVLEYFISKASDMPGLENAVFSASRERALGLGTMGFHSYLQRRRLPFDCALALSETKRIFSDIRNKAEQESYRLGEERGCAPDYDKGAIYPKRNVYLLAVAPNAKSSIICGNTSPSIEPVRANIYRQDTDMGSYIHKNPYLNTWLNIVYEKDADKIWKDIAAHNGSIQHIKSIPDGIKSVFKTAIEIDQRWIIEHAAMRQQYIDQGQSVNLFFRPDTSREYLHQVHFDAWEKGLKTLYYVRTEALTRAEDINKRFDRHDFDKEECLACHG